MKLYRYSLYSLAVLWCSSALAVQITGNVDVQTLSLGNSLTYTLTADANLNDDDPEGNSEVDNEAEDWKQEEAYKDGWMTNFRQVSSHESLSQAVRKVIRH